MKNSLLPQQKLSSRRLTIKVFFLLIAIILLSSPSCKKEEPLTPHNPPRYSTMSLSCYVNGELWVAQVPPFLPTERHLSASFHMSKNLLLMTATRMGNDFPRESIKIRIDSFEQNAVKYTNTSSLPYSNYSFRCNNGEANIDFEIADDTNNEIVIDYFSLENRIISGRFSMIVNALRCPDEQIEIRDGKFDVEFSILE